MDPRDILAIQVDHAQQEESRAPAAARTVSASRVADVQQQPRHPEARGARPGPNWTYPAYDPPDRGRGSAGTAGGRGRSGQRAATGSRGVELSILRVGTLKGGGPGAELPPAGSKTYPHAAYALSSKFYLIGMVPRPNW